MRRSSIVFFLVVTLVAGLVGVSQRGARRALAAEPDSGTVRASGEGGDSLSYKGTVPTGAGSPAECQEGINADVFRLYVRGTGGDFYNSHSALLTFRLDWDPGTTAATQDIALHVRHDGKEVAYSDGGEPKETTAVMDPDPGRYRVIACAFSVAVPQDYLGKIFFTTERDAKERLPRAANARGLKFMPIVTVDPQRDVAEPSLRIDKAGNYYTCGPFGASRSADYAQKSEDGGDTFRILGTPPAGTINAGGGGDCELAVNPEKNEQGNYNVAYTGLEALLNFSASKSEDAGRTWFGPPFSSSFPLVDRQWLEAHGRQEVYLFYNQIPFGGTLQRSTDGGLTYAPADEQGEAAPSIYRPGNIVIDHSPNRNPDGSNNETVYIAYTDDNWVKVSRTTDQGETFTQHKVRRGEGNPSNLFPSLTIDTKGNLYAAWTEKGSFNTYYSFSRDHGENWSPKKLVNRRGASSTVMPWIEAGSPGRVAVSFYCSPVDGNPEVGGRKGFKGPWHVCVNQSLNALSSSPDFSQVRATHHPIHWDSICLSGLACNVTNGDRTLLDFFQLRPDPRTGRVSVAFNESNKAPRHDVGPIAIVTFAQQKQGPSLLARVGRVRRDPRAIVRSASHDPRGDARFPFSSFGAPPARTPVPSLDIRDLTLSRSHITRRNGNRQRAIKIRMDVRGLLSDAALAETLARMESQELKFVVRWFSGYRPDYVIANWVPGQGFTFFGGNLRKEITADGKLQVYPAPDSPRRPIPGHVNRADGVITMKMPYARIQDFDFRGSLTAKPDLTKADPGDKIFEVTAFTFGAPNPSEDALSYYNQADSTPSFDYRLKR